ncbi:PQQ-binding-like beta-propeller repeat protein [Alloacidobacterium sp.]|uniref:outer membrane protein assembly factor BamB family protein n=1 Tax=Alloacidobacterium sp. TaxID=2951999 RepID=UPI002D79223F|nr:PQQ-binding-like beta-propeller repeat protein [Alloacidobacterium sp.]
MEDVTMNSSIQVADRKQTASFRIVLSIVTIAPLWLMLATTDRSGYAQTSDDVSSSTATTPSPADWTQFHRDNMQRWNPYETELGVTNVGNLSLKWSSPIGGFSNSSPAVANGVVYVGSIDKNVYALNADTGARLWSFTTGDEVESSPAVANGMVYVGSDDNKVYALNASTGAMVWSFIAGNSVQSPLTVVNGVVYVGGSDFNIYALNASDGAKLWSFAAQFPFAMFSSPAVVNGAVYVGSNDSNLYALDASTGAKLWSFTAGNAVSTPAVANGVVYFGSQDHNVYALNASTGAKLWSFVTGATILSSPAIANGVIYIGSYDHNVYALNASTGVKLWSFTTGNTVTSAPAVANGVVYVGSDDHNMYALNASTGAKLWSRAVGNVIYASPVVTNGTVYAVSNGITAFSLGADLFLRIFPSTTTVHQGDLLTYAFPVWNLGPDNSNLEVLNTQVPAGTTFDYIRISGTPGLGTCTHPPFQGTGQIVCHEGDSMAPNTTWTVRLTVKVTAPAGTVITANAATMSDTPDPNLANNTATVSLTVQ